MNRSRWRLLVVAAALVSITSNTQASEELTKTLGRIFNSKDFEAKRFAPARWAPLGFPGGVSAKIVGADGFKAKPWTMGWPPGHSGCQVEGPLLVRVQAHCYGQPQLNRISKFWNIHHPAKPLMEC